MSGYVIFAIIKTTKSPTFKNILKQGIQSIRDIFVHGVTEHSKLKHPYVYIPTNANHHNISLCTVSIIERETKMFLLFSHLIGEKIASFLTYLKSWWKVVLVFGKEHADWSNIGGVMKGWRWKIKFVKIHFFCQNVNLKVKNTPFMGPETKMDDPILFPVKSSYIFW